MSVQLQDITAWVWAWSERFFLHPLSYAWGFWRPPADLFTLDFYLRAGWQKWSGFWRIVSLKDLQSTVFSLIQSLVYFHDLIMGWPITKWERRALFNLMFRDKVFRDFWIPFTLLLALGLFLTLSRGWHRLRRPGLYNYLLKFHVFFQAILYYLNRTIFATPEAFIGYALALLEDGQADRARQVLDKGLTEYPKSAKLRHTFDLLKGERI